MAANKRSVVRRAAASSRIAGATAYTDWRGRQPAVLFSLTRTRTNSFVVKKTDIKRDTQPAYASEYAKKRYGTLRKKRKK